MKVKVDELKKLTLDALRKFGYSDAEAQSICDVLLYAQLRGNNQGIVKLTGAGIPKPANAGKIEVQKETKLSTLLNGHSQHAMIVVNQAVDIAIKKAKEHGVGLVGVNDTNTSSGAIGFYARRIAYEGLIGLVFAGSPETVAAEGSYEPIFGTNPLAIAMPTKDQPLVLDLATAAMAFFGVIEAKTAGRQLPEGVGYDKSGHLSTDPGAVMDGALRTFDKSYKGAGLSMMVQILTGPLVGASFTGIGDTAHNWGHLVLAIDPEELGGLEQLEEGVTQMIAKVKDTKKLPGIDEILVPGERGDRVAKQAWSSGEIEIEDNLFQGLKKAAGTE